VCWTMATRAALSATTLDEEVQRRLELMAVIFKLKKIKKNF